jgi:hypothetical protein
VEESDGLVLPVAPPVPELPEVLVEDDVLGVDGVATVSPFGPAGPCGPAGPGVGTATTAGGVAVDDDVVALELGGVLPADEGAGVTTVDFSQPTRPSVAISAANGIEYFMMILFRKGDSRAGLRTRGN